MDRRSNWREQGGQKVRCCRNESSSSASPCWATGPGGVYCFTPEGKVLGRINTGQRTANCKFGDDGKTLFVLTSDLSKKGNVGKIEAITVDVPSAVL